jgi:organic hydroperoxide reductase OsmC/OhrA
MSKAAVHYYATEIEWSSERAGILHGRNLPAIVFGAPPEFKGREGQWSPEHLFVSSLNACFMLTFLAVAENSRVPVAGFSSTATGKLETVQGGGYQITEIVVKPRVVVAAKDLERVPRILEKAKENCFITNSIKSSVTIDAEILHQQTGTSPDAPAATPAASPP